MKYFQLLEKVIFFSKFRVCILWFPLSFPFYCHFPHWEKQSEKNSMKKMLCPDLKNQYIQKSTHGLKDNFFQTIFPQERQEMSA